MADTVQNKLPQNNSDPDPESLDTPSEGKNKTSAEDPTTNGKASSDAQEATSSVVPASDDIAPRGKPPQLLQHPLLYISFEWFTRLVWRGRKTKIEYDHLFELPDDMLTDANYPAFKEGWKTQHEKAEGTEKGRASLAKATTGHGFRVLLRTLFYRHRVAVAIALSLQICYTAFQFAGPVILQQIIGYMQGQQTGKGGVSTATAYVLAALLFLFPLMGSTCATHSNRLSIGVQVQIRSELAAALYRKSLHLSSRAKQATETGKIVNLMSADINQIMTFFYPFFSQLITAPITIIGAIVYLIINIKWATCIGLAVLLVCTPISSRFVVRLSQLRREMLKHTDKRVKLMNQLLVGIRVLKMYAWEAAQEEAVLEARRQELHELKKCVPLRVGMQTLLFAAPTLASVASFVAYGAASPSNFTPKTIFTSIALFNLLRFPLIMLPFALVQLGNALVSMGRISQFLSLEERKDKVERMDRPGLVITDGEFFWPEQLPEQADTSSKKKKRPKRASKRKGMGCLPSRSAKRQAAADQDAEKETEVEAAPKKAKVVVANVPGGVKDGNGVAVVGAQDRLSSDESESSGSKETPSSKIDSEGTEVEKAVENGGIKGEDGEMKAAGGEKAGEKGEEGEMKAAGDGCFWLRNVNLCVKQGQLVCVVGRVGSGKSSLIAAVLGEMEQSKGVVKLGGSMAYVAQQAWIVNDTLQNNVLFGQELDEHKWQQCVQACCLEADLKVLPGGAQTEIGEKGINLSGGQKQRVSLARATYQDADVYVLDDPLSAVDVHVGKHIFENCISGILADRTRVLVTNQLQYLDRADHILFMEAGGIAVQGTFDQCKHNDNFMRMMNEFNSQAGQQQGTQEADDVVDSTVVVGHTNAGDAAFKKVKLQRQDTAEITRDIASSAYNLAAGRSMITRQPTARLAISHSVDPPPPQQQTVPEPVKDDTHERTSRSSADGKAEGTRAAAATAQAQDVDGEDGHQPSPFDAPPDDEPQQMEESKTKPKGESEAVEIARKVLLEDEAEFRKRVAPTGLPISKSVKYTAQQQQKAKGRLVVKEDQEEGQIGWKVYWYYIKAFAVPSFCALLVLWSCEQSLRVLTSWWLSRWTNAEVVNNIKRAQGQPTDSVLALYLSVYLGLAALFVSFTFLRSLNNLTSALRASRKVHKNSLEHLVRAPVLFFDTTPVGRILNRYSKDTDDMDFMLPQSISEFGNCVFQLLSTIIFICIIQYWFIVGIVPLAVLYWCFQHVYRKSYIELQRLDAVTRSPIYAHFSETLTGTETIRAYGRTQQFEVNNSKKIDYNHRAYFNLKIADEWLAMRLDLVGASITFMAAILAVNRAGTRSAALLALTLTESLEVTVFLKFAVRSAAMFESRFNSVERLLAYVRLPQEAPRMIEDKSPDASWPSEGAITFSDVHMRYRPGLDPVLKGVSFHVASGDKVGIVGRTGSGKSSLIVTLFRLVEPFQGNIVLDGVNVLELGLDDVRGRIAAIPQDPILFSGTVRSNLDPFQKHTDADIWEALAHVDLKDVVSGLPSGLLARVAEGGDNFSLGQRQMLCVARALLRKPKVLVADEATASVDTETDSLIQKTIRANFNSCTVLTIAHRLNTILDSTKVLVMDGGHVSEYDTVPRLLSKKQSAFKSMVSDAGLLDEDTYGTAEQDKGGN